MLSRKTFCFSLILSLMLTRFTFAQEVLETGTLEIVVTDFVDGSHQIDYFLQSTKHDRPVPLKLPKGIKKEKLRQGQNIAVKLRNSSEADLLDQDLSLESGSNLESTSDASLLPLTERKTIIIMVDLTDAKASKYFNLPDINNKMYGAADSVNELYGVSSFDQLQFQGDANRDGTFDSYGPLQLSLSGSTCDYYGWSYEAEDKLTQMGVNLSQYTHRLFVVPYYNDTGCTWAGKANLGCGTFCRTWISEAQNMVVFAHELGHNLGMGHAAVDANNDGTAESIYGDYSDPMGESRTPVLFNPGHVNQLNWYGSNTGSSLTVTQSGQFTVDATELSSLFPLNPYSLKIQKPNTNEWYFISLRSQQGPYPGVPSNYTSGISIHRHHGSNSTYTYYLDTLADGQSFIDNINGITIRQISSSQDSAVVDIKLGTDATSQCSYSAPTLSLSPSALWVKPSESINVSMTLTNQDSSNCSNTSFNLAWSSSASTITSLPGTLTLVPAGSTTLQLDMTTGQEEGLYTSQISASASLHPTVSTSVTVQVDGTAPLAPTALSASKPDRKGRVTLNWSGAADSGSGVSHYLVYRHDSFGSQLLGQTTSLSYIDTPSNVTSTSYTVFTVDRVGLTSGASPSALPNGGSTSTSPSKGKR